MFNLKIVALLLLFVSFTNPVQAAFFPAGTVAGNRFFSQPVVSGQVKGLFAACTGSNFDTMKLPDGTNYQVTAGKKAILIGFKAMSGSSAGYLTFGYGTASVANGAAPAGSKPSGLFGYEDATSGSYNAQMQETYYEFPASSFPYILCGGTGAYATTIVIETTP